MPLHASRIDDEGTLVVTFDGRLDFSIARDVFVTARRATGDIETCVLDLRKVERVFDSGIALLRLLQARMRDANIQVRVLAASDDLAIKVRGERAFDNDRCLGVGV
jgi:ABC-type transporter Mla MlaB component